MSTLNWRTINIDALDPESPANFELASLAPSVAPVSAAEVQSTVGQIRQLLRGGDAEGALRGALENAPYGADERSKDMHGSAVVEVLQSIRQADMTPLLTKIFQSQGGTELLDVLMKYIYKGMSTLPPASHSNPSTPSKTMTPQSTGFSSVPGRSFGSGAGEGGGQTMSVLLSWHEKVVDITGVGSIMRVMSDRRTV